MMHYFITSSLRRVVQFSFTNILVDVDVSEVETLKSVSMVSVPNWSDEEQKQQQKTKSLLGGFLIDLIGRNSFLIDSSY